MESLATPPETAPQVVLSFPWTAGSDPQFLRNREWLVTNGLGGYASGTLLGENTRRYHGLFVPNLPAPRGRTVLLPRCDETFSAEGRSIPWGGAEYADGHRDGAVDQSLNEFRLDWMRPVWHFTLEGRRLQKRIMMPHGQSTVYVEYQLLSGDPIEMRLRPYVALRGHDRELSDPHQWPLRLTMHDERYDIEAFPGAPILQLGVVGSPHHFMSSGLFSENVFYPIEKQRGLDYVESLYSPGYFTVTLKPREAVALVASIEPWENVSPDSRLMFDAERQRMQKVLDQASPAAQGGWAAHLTLAADQFIVKPGTRAAENALLVASGRPARSVIAGYHWFTDWGRDTMISLEGLALCTGRFEEAKAILHTFARYVHNGLLPNHFPEGQPTALYHTIDASLWYFHAVDRYQAMSGDDKILKELFPILHTIIEAHLIGTDYGIGVDPEDGLIRGATPHSPLTWMDAQVDGWVVTPRRGKPVEIQGLWYNALCLMRRWAERLGQPNAFYEQAAQKARASFNQKFWNAEKQCLFDLLTEEGKPDATLRPNQLFTLSLPHPILDQERWEGVVRIVQEKLLTPLGVRTLDPQNPEYRPRYEGNRHARDGAYHQGMVWAWLIGPFLDAWLKVHPEDRKGAADLLRGFEAHLHDAGVGSISEIFDGEPPHHPRGCIAQAWSVAEVLRHWCNLQNPPTV